MAGEPAEAPLPSHLRPLDPTPLHTAELPSTPTRDRNIPASAWLEAPEALLRAGDDLGEPEPTYKRRIGRWLLWRTGPARRGDARYVAVDAERLDRVVTFRLQPDGSGRGEAPDGSTHLRFRSWKEALRDTD